MKSLPDNPFYLLTRKRFAPIFVTQFLGALNDNIFKNALVLMIAYGLFTSVPENQDAGLLINLAAGLFILPFFLFSSLAGQVADKYEKSMLIRRIKAFEIVIMAGAALAFYFKSIPGLLVLLFLMGAQSAFFGPVKYAVLPQHLKSEEIVRGNGMVGMGTFIAILTGTITAGILVQAAPAAILGLVLVGTASAGWLASRRIPKAPSSSSNLALSWNLAGQTWETIRTARQSGGVMPAILAVSWFWFLGAAYLTQFPAYTRTVLNGSESVVTLLLAGFSIGIGVGSMLCGRLSGKKVEPGLIPIGALGMAFFGFDLSLAHLPSSSAAPLTLSQFLMSDGGWRIILDLAGMGICGGLYTVPLYAFIQTRVPSAVRARVVAANNIINAALMVMASLAGILCLSILNMTIPQFFMGLAVLNGLAGIVILFRIPRFFIRFLAWIISCFMYRITKSGDANIPETGAAVLVSNHVSFMDWLLISAACRRPVRFIMYEPIYRIPVLHWLFRWVKAIPIQSRRTNPGIYQAAFREISAALENGELICIFPEGKLSRDGRIDVFKGGIQKMVKDTPVPVIPMAIRGMWGSFFSHKNGRALTSFPRRFFSRVGLNIGRPVMPDRFTLESLREEVAGLAR